MPRSRQSRGLSVPGPERAGRRHVILPHSYASARPFTLDDARFMEAVSHVIAGALDREASEQELRRRALEDPLTGLANRALLSQQLEAQLRHARRLGDHVSVLPRPGRSSSAASRPCVVLAAEITNTSTDFSQLDPMVTATLNELQRIGHTELPEAVVADAGYWNEQHIDEVVANKHIPVLIPPDKISRVTPRSTWSGGRYDSMRNVLATDLGRLTYRKRKQTVEPVFGHTKHDRGFTHFNRRGRTKVRTEWRLLMMTQNLSKLHRHQLAATRA